MGRFFGTPLRDGQLRELMHGGTVTLEEHEDQRTGRASPVRLRLRGRRENRNRPGEYYPDFEWRWA